MVTLKGSGTIICRPWMVPRINPTGNGRLASAGTGDVLAGMIGAHLTQGQSAFEANCLSVFHNMVTIALAGQSWAVLLKV